MQRDDITGLAVENGRQVFWCGFAPEGTYGHECGKPATLTGIQPSKLTGNGIFYAHRCAIHGPKCKGRDNADIKTWEPLNPDKHVNVWGRQ